MRRSLNSIIRDVLRNKIIGGATAFNTKEILAEVKSRLPDDYLEENRENIVDRFLLYRIALYLAADGKKSVLHGTGWYADPYDVGMPQILEKLIQDLNADIISRQATQADVQIAYEALIDGQQYISEDGEVLASPTKDEMIEYLQSLA